MNNKTVAVNPKFLSIGTQILYVPNHAEGDVEHEDVEQGFVTSVGSGVAFCRYWRKDGYGLRITANSEATPLENIVLFDSHNQAEIEAMMKKYALYR